MPVHDRNKYYSIGKYNREICPLLWLCYYKMLINFQGSIKEQISWLQFMKLIPEDISFVPRYLAVDNIPEIIMLHGKHTIKIWKFLGMGDGKFYVLSSKITDRGFTCSTKLVPFQDEIILKSFIDDVQCICGS
jgi:hypothetical protein